MDWDNTTWLVSQVHPPTSYCADHSQLSSNKFCTWFRLH